MDKFVVAIKPKAVDSKRYRTSVQMEIEPHSKIKELSEKTGISMTKLFTQMVDFCYDRLEIVDAITAESRCANAKDNI